jgi:uncharacterized membrane protein
MHTSNPNGTSAGATTEGAGSRSPSLDALARGLGWASLGLGVPQVTTPGRFDRAIGIRPGLEPRAWTLAVGVRELGAAAGILLLHAKKPTVWARVAGDVKDLTLLVRALQTGRSERPARTIAAIAAVLGIGATDLYTALGLTRREHGEQSKAADPEGPAHVKVAITVRRSREDVFRFWRDFSNLPSFMAHLESVHPNGDGRTHWTAKAPAGRTVEWDAQIVEERPGELISWRSIGGDVDNAGTVRFTDAPGNRGTEIHLDLRYDPPGGKLGTAVAKLLGEEPRQQVADDLRRFKQVTETGMVVRSEGSPEGAKTSRLLRQRPAQPLPVSEATAAVR